MPRTIAVECPGCPPIRALTTDVLGLVKVIEARGKAGIPKVIETWGPPDASRSIVAASYADRESNPLLVVARKNGYIEFLNPLNGESLATSNADDSSTSSVVPQDDVIAGLHLFKNMGDLASSPARLLTCTEKGKACLRSMLAKDEQEGSEANSLSKWNVCNAGKVTCSKVDGSEIHALFGGKGIEVNLWDLGECNKVWTAKPPPSNSLGIFTPTWFTSATFLSKDDHRKIAAGTNNHQVRLYDISAQRRPVISIDFRESSIKAITEDPDGYSVYIGTGIGDLASFDMRTGKLLGSYIGKCSGSIRSIARHPNLPVVASCGLDGYLRFWDAKTRQSLSAVYLKQHLTNVVIDSHFSDEEFAANNVDKSCDQQTSDDVEANDEEEFPQTERFKDSKRKGSNKKRSNDKNIIDKTRQVLEVHPCEHEEKDELMPTKRKKNIKGNQHESKAKKKKGCHEVKVTET